MKREKILSLLLVVFLQISSTAFSAELQESNISYVGAFRMSATSGCSGQGYAYGLRGLGFYNDPTYGPTLYARGHDTWCDGSIGQVAIPTTFSTSTTWSELPEATIIQALADVTDGDGGGTGTGWDLYGIMPYNDRLIVGLNYDYDSSQSYTHGASGFDLSVTNDFTAFEQVGGSGDQRWVGGYMATIPSSIQSLFGGATAVTGGNSYSIISATSDGPAISLFNPDDIGNETPPHSTTTLLYYNITTGHGLSENCPSSGACEDPLFNVSSHVSGVVFPDGWDSVIFVGVHDIYEGDGYCYGTVEECTATLGGPICTEGKGEHSDSMQPVIWHYPLSDIVDVYNGSQEVYEPVPDLWESAVSDINITDAPCLSGIRGMAYDPDTMRIYVAAFTDGGTHPTVYVFEIDEANEIQGQSTNFRYYLDADGDGYSDGTYQDAESDPGSTWFLATELTATSGDCNDSNTRINPGATDSCGNGVDEDCSGSDEICPTGGRTVAVSNLSELYSAFSSEQDGDEIVIASGTYVLNSGALVVNADNLIVRSSTGNRDDVVIQGDGFASDSTIKSIFYFPQGAFGQNTTIKDLTVGRVGWHAIFFNGDGSGNGSTIDNVRVFDCYEQFIKGADVLNVGTDNVSVKNSLFEFTSPPAPNYYTGGIDIHAGDGWLIQDNEFKNIRSPSGRIAEHAIHMWSNDPYPGANIIERNKILDCDRGIGIWNNTGSTVIRNNMIASNGLGAFPDVGIDIQDSQNQYIYNNTIWNDPDNGYYAGIEVRGATTTAVVRNNLTNAEIRDINSPTVTETNNIELTAIDLWLVSPTTADLHLSASVPSVVDQGYLGVVTDDFDGQTRSDANDIGADELKLNLVIPPSRLRLN